MVTVFTTLCMCTYPVPRHCDDHQMYNQGYNTHTSHTDFSTDLSWDGQSLILWQQWRREGVGRGGLEGREDSHKVLCRSTAHVHTYTYYVRLHSNN